MEQETTRAAFEFHQAFVKNFPIPHLASIRPFGVLSRIDLATSMLSAWLCRHERFCHRVRFAALAWNLSAR
jgi:hypothetical protein